MLRLLLSSPLRVIKKPVGFNLNRLLVKTQRTGCRTFSQHSRSNSFARQNENVGIGDSGRFSTHTIEGNQDEIGYCEEAEGDKYVGLERYWKHISRWKETPTKEWLSYKWQVAHTVQTNSDLLNFLEEVLPRTIPRAHEADPQHFIKTKSDFISDVKLGMSVAPMRTKLPPHLLAVVNWADPLSDPIRRQFIPMHSALKEDHPALLLDSLGEQEDSVEKGLVHRYPHKALFLATKVCPTYCRYCTRSYAVGGNTNFEKKKLVPSIRRWQLMIDQISNTDAIHDVVLSGGDCFLLEPEQLAWLGEKLLSIAHVKRIRIATRGLSSNPGRFLDENDAWFAAAKWLSDEGRKMEKAVAIHTHFNHPNEMTWVTKLAANKLFRAGITVRCQTVLLRGVNDSVEVMGDLISKLANHNIIPYYVYQGDMVKGVEDLRTPLSTILHIEEQLRGFIGGFMFPQFVVDLPGGGGKRLANSYIAYDEKTGISRFRAPGVKSGMFEYHDPKWSIEQPKVGEQAMR